METLERIKRVYRAFAAGDHAPLLEILAPDIEWHDLRGLPYHDDDATYHGREAVAERVLAPLPHHFNNLEVVPHTFLAHGETVVVTGQLQGNWMASARAFEANMVHVWTIREGRCVRFFHAADTAEMMGPATW